MFASPAFAQSTGAVAPSGLEFLVQTAPLILLVVAFYFLMIRPQQRRMKQLQEAINAVKKGDEVTTAGGIVGKVVKADGALVEVEIAPNVRVKVVKATIASVASQGGARPAND
ncbi:preprotein translocase subunit YajC [Sphingomonas sp.]|uniref:preprotein translocase subunit YajC n=1 Tax=Sphingomonas sp. TaxID=28214 RepID=UPI001DB04379|nr:preprotein translocase subunit YajC [Sphingomonas sp.]MBX9797202.1 preprotein translocase subunit YajC [Sphingomonas sp.]